ncbi:MAG: DUF2085 domain-containing protein [Chloroflexi bacterium]|nr:DUF2085 domain-containing protein [Chloroflexota bacterium]
MKVVLPSNVSEKLSSKLWNIRRRYHTADPLWHILLGASCITITFIGLGLATGSSLRLLRWLGGGVCAQILSHTFAPGGHFLPLCSRDTGIYLGIFLSTAWLAAKGQGTAARTPHLGRTLVLLLPFVALGVDGFNALFNDLQLPHLYAPTNTLRLIMGLAAGSALLLLVSPVYATTLSAYDIQRAQRISRQSAFIFFALLAIATGGILSNASILAIPIAFISMSGLFTILVMLNRIFLHGSAGLIHRGMPVPFLSRFPLLALVSIAELGVLSLIHALVIA